MSTEFIVVFPLFPRVTQLDFTGPLEVFQRIPNARCVLATTDGGSLAVGSGMVLQDLVPLHEVSSCDLLCVPGGYGVTDALEDARYVPQLRRLASDARLVTAVCTGSLLLGAAGLLLGKRAACHWAWRDLLPMFGAVADPGRVVVDGPVITGGGVTAGIDLALRVVAELEGEDFARAVTLGMEYAPMPPFGSGRPELASPELVERTQRALHGERERRMTALKRYMPGA